MGLERAVLVPAAYVYLLREGSVLLLRRAHTGFMDGRWAGLAGHVEYGESVLSAAVREAGEEAGVTVDGDDLIPVCAMHRRASPAPIDQRIDLFYTCTRWRGEPVLLETDKADAIGWHDLSALPEPVVAHERVVLDHLGAGVTPPAVLTFGF
jgi:8-oxo-dGTP diphosphatase